MARPLLALVAVARRVGKRVLMALWVIVLVCATSEPVCDQAHARIYKAGPAQPGFVICGVSMIAPLTELDLRPGESLHIRCELRQSS